MIARFLHLRTPGKELFYASIMLACMMLQATPASARTVTNITFEGSSYNLITDDSGKDWLSLLATDGQTYGFVDNQINNAIGDYADYHFATRDQVKALFVEYGAMNINLAPSETDFAPASALQSDFGSTGTISVGEPFTFGYTSTILVQGSNSFPNFHLSPIVQVQTNNGEAQFRTMLSVDVINDTHTGLRGSWLIRNTAVVVPTPTAAAATMLFVGLFGLVSARDRKRDRKRGHSTLFYRF